MSFSLIALGAIFQFVPSVSTIASAVASIILLLVFFVGFEMGVGSLFWLLVTELFPEEYKDVSAATLNVFQWLLNIVVTASFPSLVEWFSQGIVFWAFGTVSVVCFAFLLAFLPETKSIHADEIKTVYEQIA